jgi:hypothetical protein
MKFFSTFFTARWLHWPGPTALAIGILACAPGQARAASVTLRPAKDTTIYGSDGVNFSNGAGRSLFVGSNGERWVLRSLIAFDLAGQIPAGATINSATLTLTANTPQNTASTVRLHRVLANWGQGSSVALQGGGGGGGGAPATVGDATWNARFFNTELWTTPGGDFTPTPSASQRVATNTGPVSFASAGLVADVQAWVNNAATNFGWILVAENESAAAVRFASSEGSPAPTLQVDFTPSSTPVNVAPTITTQPASQSVVAGAAVTFTVSATGTPAPTFQWRKDNTAIAGATSGTLTLPAVTSADLGSYSVVATNAAGSITSAPATLTLITPGSGSAARLSNLSVRAAMASGQTLIVGFSVSGGNRSILVRGVGPTLASFGVSAAMADPRLELYDGGVRVAENEDWGSGAALSNAFSSVGAFALVANSKDAALLQSVDGTRSVQLKGTGPGVALVELYDTGSGNTPRLVNVSARNQVGTGDAILIFGFFVDGSGTKNLLIRAVGPRLADLGVSGVLSDPKLDVFRSGTAAAVASNDNWDPSLAPTFSAVGAFGLTVGSKDAALVTSLAPGSYTVQVAGVNGATGEALVEIYEVP